MTSSKAILIGSDHAGYALKEQIKSYLTKKALSFIDAGANHIDHDDDYPVFASRVAEQISSGKFEKGIVICGTGIGASITANRWKRVRAALCHNAEMARMSRLHNDSNVLVLGGRTTPIESAIPIIDAWLEQTFDSGGRHSRRVQQIDDLTK